MTIPLAGLTGVVLLTAFTAAVVIAGEPVTANKDFYPPLRKYLDQRATEFEEIADDHKAALQKIAQYVRKQRDIGQTAKLYFICTHNSRRSHLSQICAATAAEHYGVGNVATYSGGTEATAFNPRAVSALQRAGFQIEKDSDNPKNPRYAVRFRDAGTPMICYSKVYSESPNPKEDFCAVLTCSQADTSCPSIQGASLRVALPFVDPKVSDDTPEEAAAYDERCRQICREMMYLFSRVAKEN